MASTSSASSSVQKRFKYDVFLSFRGEDTRKTFVDHLYHALVNKGIIIYKDDETIDKGERIKEQLIRSIQDSRFYIIVFSKNYASSSWCLNELVEIMKCQKTAEHTAYPVSFDVEPTEVRHQSGAVGEAFAKHVRGSWSSVLPLDCLCSIVESCCNRSSSSLNGSTVDLENEDDVERWRNALTEAASLAGMELKNTFNGHEARCIQQLVEEVSLKLNFFNSYIDEKLVGMETRVKDVVSSLEIDSDDVRMIGIKGMGGGGKTTLARAVFDYISISFEGKSFVENVREGSKGSGLKKLQKQIISAVLNDKSVDVTSVFDGKYMMKKMMRSRKVLIVLDDVDDIEQLEALAGEPNWFKPGSRIIITTRDEQVLISQRVNLIHNVNLLSNEEASCLFSRYAFGREIPVQGYEELSDKVIHYAAGLPLTIKVLGSHLCGRIEHEWVDAIERLKIIPLEKTLKRLEISYDGLENDQKEIFLDTVCLLKGASKDLAIRILEGCGLNAKIGLRVLEQKCLITISDIHGLRFHDHIEEMGRNIVRGLHPNEPSRHNRLWIREEIEDILVDELGTEATRSIKLMYPNLHPAVIMEGLRKMRELRFLWVVASTYIKCELDEASKYLPNALQFLYWYQYPFRSLPKSFQANKLVNLEMIRSNISELYEGGERKVFDKLKFLDLSWSKLRTFDLRMAPNLEKLYLKECNDFVELHMHVECPRLKFLNLSGTKLSNFNLGMTPHLETLDLGGCNEFVELKIPVECPKLKFLNLRGSKVSNLNIGLIPHLERLDLEYCYYLQETHAPVGCLKNLLYLKLSGCSKFEYFLVKKRYDLLGLDSVATLELTAESVDICPLHPNSNLPMFFFKCKYDEPLPSWSGNLEKFISFGACACTNLESFSASICGLQYLRELTLEGSILRVPKDLWQLDSLERLTLCMKKIKHLSDSICMLKHLKYLELESCWHLEQLPDDLGKLECLEELRLADCTSLRDIPNSICDMKSLIYIDISYCILVEKLPEELGRLRCLFALRLDHAGISCLPQSIYQLEGLWIIGSRWQLELYGFTSFRETSGHTSYCVQL